MCDVVYRRIEWKWLHFPLCMYGMHIPTNMKDQLSRPLGILSSISMCVRYAMRGYRDKSVPRVRTHVYAISIGHVDESSTSPQGLYGSTQQA